MEAAGGATIVGATTRIGAIAVVAIKAVTTSTKSTEEIITAAGTKTGNRITADGMIAGTVTMITGGKAEMGKIMKLGTISAAVETMTEWK